MTDTELQVISPPPEACDRVKRRCGFWGWCVRGSLILLLLLTLLVVATGYLLLRPSQIQARAVEALQKLSHAEVSIDFAQVTWSGELRLEGMELRVPGVAGFEGKLIRADHVTVRPEWTSLIWGEPAIRWVDVDQLHLYITENRDTDRYAIETWLEQFKGQDDGPAVKRLPEVSLDQTTVVFSYVQAGQHHAIDQFKLDASLVADADSTTTYLFRVDPDESSPRKQFSIAGSIDLLDGVIVARLTDLMFDRETSRLLPDAIRPWWLQRDPQGHITELEILLSSSPEHDAPSVAAIMKFDHAAVTLPMGPLQPRLQNVKGELQLSDWELRIDQLKGDVADLGYRVNGYIQDLSQAADSPMNITVTTSEFDVPQKLSELIPLPDAALEHYERLSPSGTFSVQTRLVRQQPDEKLRIQTLINLINARMVYHGFQYPVTHITGRVVIDDRSVTIEEFKGQGPSGASISATGTIFPAGKEAEVNITMRATDVPIDDHLRNAMDEKRLKLFNQFFNPTRYQQLLKDHAIRSSNLQESNAPFFKMGGKTNLIIDLHRPRGLDQKYRNHITVDATGLSAVMEHWPYPATATAGRVDITPDGTLIRDIQIVGPTGARATVHGKVVYDPDSPGVTTDVQVDVASLPIDDLLVATLRPEQAKWIDKLGFRGDIQAQTHITRELQDDRLDFVAKGSILSGSIRPFEQQLKLEQVRGDVELTPRQLKLTNLNAKHQRMNLSGDADIHWQDDQPRVKADFKLSQVDFSPLVLDLLPDDHADKKRLLELVRKHELRGMFDASTTIHLDQGQFDYRCDIKPNRLSFKFRDQQLEATQMQGRIRFAGPGVELHQLSGRLDEMNLTLDGLVLPGERISASMLVSAKADRIGRATRAFLPEQAVNTIEKLSFNSAYRIEQAQLHWNSPELQQPGLGFQGDVHFTEAQGVIAVAFREGHGKVAVNFTKADSALYPEMNLALHMNEVRVRDRRLHGLTMQVKSSDDLKTLAFDRIKGNLYNGTLTGKGSVGIASPQQFVFDLAVVNAELGPVINPDQENTPHAQAGQNSPVARNVDNGLLSTSISVMGRVDRPGEYRGRGQLDITRAQLFKQPIALTLLHTVNLAMPVSSSFEKVTASYTLEGQTIQIQSLTFWSPFAAVSGGGMIDLANGKLDLAMVARNPSAPKLGAIADMIHLVKDEVVGIRVDGTMENPRSRIVSFEGIVNAWRRLFPDLFRGR